VAFDGVAFATRRQVLTGAPFLQTQDCEGPPAAVEKFCLRTSEPRAIFKFGIRTTFLFGGGSMGLITQASSSKVFASFRSTVSKPGASQRRGMIHSAVTCSDGKTNPT
jgi:hypothetical protein